MRKACRRLSKNCASKTCWIQWWQTRCGTDGSGYDHSGVRFTGKAINAGGGGNGLLLEATELNQD